MCHSDKLRQARSVQDFSRMIYLYRCPNNLHSVGVDTMRRESQSSYECKQASTVCLLFFSWVCSKPFFRAVFLPVHHRNRKRLARLDDISQPSNRSLEAVVQGCVAREVLIIHLRSPVTDSLHCTERCERSGVEDPMEITPNGLRRFAELKTQRTICLFNAASGRRDGTDGTDGFLGSLFADFVSKRPIFDNLCMCPSAEQR